MSKSSVTLSKIIWSKHVLGELQEAWELGEGSSQGICYYATLWGQGGGRKVIWSIIILYFSLNIYGGHFLTACPRKCKFVVGDPISNPGCWQSTEWWVKGWDPPWQTSKMSQLTSGPPRILTNILCILINIPCILINIPCILTNILIFCQAHSDGGCFLLAVSNSTIFKSQLLISAVHGPLAE